MLTVQDVVILQNHWDIGKVTRSMILVMAGWVSV